MNIEMRTLEEVGKWGSGGTPSASRSDYYGGKIPWLIIEDLNDGIVTQSQKHITESGLKNSSAKMVEPGTLLIAMYGSIGKLGIAKIPCATNQAIAFCQPNPQVVDTRFLFYFLLHSRPKMLAAGRGGTQQNISQNYLKDFPIPLPPLDEQKRIAAMLERADHLRRTHRFARTMSDTFLQSVFLQMFGDNELNYERRTLDELARSGRGTFVNGPFGSDLLTSELLSEGVPVVYIRDIRGGSYARSSTVCVSEAKAHQLSVCQVHPGDVIVAKVGDPPGMAAIYPSSEPMGIVTQDVIRIKVNHSLVTPEYLASRLNSDRGKLALKPIIVEGTRERFSLGSYKGIEIPIPPLEKQQQFAAIVQKYERMRAGQIEAERQAEHLFQTLLHRAFATS